MHIWLGKMHAQDVNLAVAVVRLKIAMYLQRGHSEGSWFGMGDPGTL